MNDQAFDAIAPTYDATFTHRTLALWLREAVQVRLPFVPGDHLLELGCGTGEDALWLVAQGMTVTATDISGEMLAAARRKADNISRIYFAQLDMNDPAGFETTVFDGIFSNFGAVNCVEDRRALANWLAARIKPGGIVALVVMNPLCPWEIVWHLAQGKPRVAFRRLQRGGEAHAGAGGIIRVWYPAPQTLIREFAPVFRHQRTVGIGALLPPSYLDHLVERHPRIFARVAALDRRWGGLLPCRWFNDHYLILLERA